jgi:peptidoglycan/xylan/chitin deacetylase (PgdA/CDA1 family)
MPKIRFPCKRHPDETAARRCYHCKEYICKMCQKVFMHHIFCSYSCMVKFLTNTYIKRIKPTRKEALLLVLILIIQILFYVLVRWELASRFNSTQQAAQDTLMLTPENIKFSLDRTGNISDYKIQISGTAPDNSMIIVQHNEKFRSPSSIAQNGRFNFESHPLYIGENRFMVWALLTPANEVLIDSFSVTYYSKKVDMLSRSIARINTTENIVALTFDAGSTANGADSIIHILKEHSLSATFFLTGQFIKKYPVVVQQLIDSHYELGNHTYSHPHLTQVEINGTQKSLTHVDRNFVYDQLNRADSILYTNFNTHFLPFWRAPFGEYNKDILLWAAEQGYRHIRWSDYCDTWDYVSDMDSPLYRTSKDIYYHLVAMEQKGLLKGSIILMHLGSDRQSDFPFRILPKFISYMIEKGYTFVTISQLLYSS